MRFLGFQLLGSPTTLLSSFLWLLPSRSSIFYDTPLFMSCASAQPYPPARRKHKHDRHRHRGEEYGRQAFQRARGLSGAGNVLGWQVPNIERTHGPSSRAEHNWNRLRVLQVEPTTARRRLTKNQPSHWLASVGKRGVVEGASEVTKEDPDDVRLGSLRFGGPCKLAPR